MNVLICVNTLNYGMGGLAHILWIYAKDIQHPM